MTIVLPAPLLLSRPPDPVELPVPAPAPAPPAPPAAVPASSSTAPSVREVGTLPLAKPALSGISHMSRCKAELHHSPPHCPSMVVLTCFSQDGFRTLRAPMTAPFKIPEPHGVQ